MAAKLFVRNNWRDV